MKNRCKGRYFIMIVLLTVEVIAGACTPAVSRQQAEQELVWFMLHYMLLHEPGSMYAQPAAAHWADAPGDASLVVWAPPANPVPDGGIGFVKTDQPIRAWWFSKGQLVEVLDKENAIQQFRQAKFSGPFPSDNGGSYYEFGILSLSNGNQQAKVYADYWCGPLCGSRSVYTLRRNAAGEWEVTDSEMKWIS